LFGCKKIKIAIRTAEVNVVICRKLGKKINQICNGGLSDWITVMATVFIYESVDNGHIANGLVSIFCGYLL
jgi:hypothetical protein